MKQIWFFIVFLIAHAGYSQCDCEVFSKKMQEYRVKNYQLEEQVSQLNKLDSNYKQLLDKQREQIIYLRKNQDSLASIPRPLLSHEDEAFYLEQLRMYYLHTGDSTKAAQIKQLVPVEN